MSKSPITCHVLDSSIGKPAPEIFISLLQLDSNDENHRVFKHLAQGITNADGRCLDLFEEKKSLVAGQTYKIVFETERYFKSTGRTSFYPYVEIAFTIQNPEEHYHIPLLISPYSFTTYRGS